MIKDISALIHPDDTEKKTWQVSLSLFRSRLNTDFKSDGLS